MLTEFGMVDSSKHLGEYLSGENWISNRFNVNMFELVRLNSAPF
jgi:hypothetical protein